MKIGEIPVDMSNDPAGRRSAGQVITYNDSSESKNVEGHPESNANRHGME